MAKRYRMMSLTGQLLGYAETIQEAVDCVSDYNKFIVLDSKPGATLPYTAFYNGVTPVHKYGTPTSSFAAAKAVLDALPDVEEPNAEI